MSVKPSKRLLLLVGLGFIPICVLPAVVARGERYIGLSAFLLCLVGAVDVWTSRSRLAGLTVSVPERIRGVLLEEQQIRVELRRNAMRQGARALRVGVALPIEVRAIQDDVLLPAPQPGSAVAVEMIFVGQRRGEFAIEAAFLGCDSMLGLWEIRQRVPVSAKILVQPALAQIARETAHLLVSRASAGRRIMARNGRGREFAQLRDFVPSDAPGDMDWKATARRRQLVVREYEVERTQDIYACVDFSRLSARSVATDAGQTVTVLDEYVRSTVMLNLAVRETGDHFGLLTFSNRVKSFIKAGPAEAFSAALRKALYPLMPQTVSPAFDEVSTALRNRVRRRALLVFFTNLEEPQLAEEFAVAAQLLGRQHMMVVASLADASVRPLFSEADVMEPDEIYQELSGHLLWKKLAALRLQLRSAGIRMHIAAPGRLGRVATNEYLDIKERQLL